MSPTSYQTAPPRNMLGARLRKKEIYALVSLWSRIWRKLHNRRIPSYLSSRVNVTSSARNYLSTKVNCHSTQVDYLSSQVNFHSFRFDVFDSIARADHGGIRGWRVQYPSDAPQRQILRLSNAGHDLHGRRAPSRAVVAILGSHKWTNRGSRAARIATTRQTGARKSRRWPQTGDSGRRAATRRNRLRPRRPPRPRHRRTRP